MNIYIGIDDTDNKNSRGTGHLARVIADTLAADYTVAGVTRHQLLFDPRVPYTAKNSCAAIILDVDETPNLHTIFETVKSVMLADFQPGSDPGLCMATDALHQAVIEFGQKAKTDLVNQAEALNLARSYQIQLAGLGGTNDGVIGALSAVGLAHLGSDGRYVRVGSIRELSGLQPVEAIIKAGVSEIRTTEEKRITSGEIIADKLRPARRESRPILYVIPENGYWQPIKLD